MDLIDQSKQTLYEKCKYKVKVWEHNFKKSNGRLPSRLDIKEAAPEVRDAYKTYFQLKTAALEETFIDVDGFYSDEEPTEPKEKNSTNTLKTELPVHNDTVSSTVPDFTWGSHLNKTPSEKKTNQSFKPSPNLNLKITRKLSVGSKIIKRNPRKSLSQVKSDTSINSASTSFNSAPMSSLSQPPMQSNSSLINHLENDFDLSSHSFGLKNTKIVSTSKFAASQPISIIQKVLHENTATDFKFKNIDIEWLKRVESSTIVNKGCESEVTKADLLSDEDIIDNSDDESSRNAFHIAKKIKYNSSLSSSQKSDLIKVNSFDEKVEINREDLNNQKLTEISVSSTVQNYDNCQNKICEPQNINREVNSELGIIRNNENIRIEASNRTDLPENISERKNGVVKSQYDGDDEELIAKFKKKNLNQNFVRINIKKKIYARGKKTQTYSKFKKKVWRNKKAFLAQGNEEYAEEKGRSKSDKLLPLDNISSIEDEDLLLTLDQASGKEISVPIHSKCESDGESSEDNMSLAQIKMSILGNKNNETEVVNINSIENKQPKLNKKSETQKKLIPKIKKTKTDLSSKSAQRKVTPKTKKSKTDIPSKSAQNKIKIGDSTKSQSKVKSKQITSNNFINIEAIDAEVNLNVNEHLFDADDDLDLLLETVRIEQALNLKGVYPLYEQNVDGSLIDTPQEVYDALKSFGHQSFRDGQEQAVMRILSGKSTLVTLSTGSGKSLCYQLPAYLYRRKYRCITLVISPLISLMEDQIKCVPGVLSAACLHGNQSKTQRDTIIKAVTSGEINILMVSPESILSSENSSGFGSILAQLPPIAFACLDEAHCLSQWSHNFRPSYLVVCRILQETLGIKTILGLTATATKTTRNSLIEQLKIPDGENGVIKDTPVPPNLGLSVSRDANKDRALLDLLLSEPFIDFKSIIIYCLRRDECEKVAAFLRTTLKDHAHAQADNSKKRKRMSLQAEPYHAGLSGSRRKSIQKAFMSGELRIVVATIAFGMGINMSDLRSVIHYNMPAKFESYVQEIGRAGRDGLPAHCHVFLDRQNNDVCELRRHIYGNSVDRHIIRKLLRKVFVSCNCEGVCVKHEVMFSMDSTVQALDVSKEIISTLLCYLELHKNKYIKILRPSYAKCRILSYGSRALMDKEALNCEALKTALKMFGNNDEPSSNALEFPVLSVSRVLNYDSGMCKRILKNLEWTNVNGQPKRSALTVEFSDLSFHLLSPGNLPDEDLDEVLDSLYRKVLEQENTAYSQLIHISKTLGKVASVTFKDSLKDNEEKSEILKEDIRDYFESEKSLEWVDIPEVSEGDRCAVVNDVRSIISRFSDENFTGRSIARIFHGIVSPNFPPYVWGRTKFWRSHLQIHFNTICKIATTELLAYK